MSKTLHVDLDAIHAWPTDLSYKTLCRVPGDWISGLVITQDVKSVTCKACLKLLNISQSAQTQWRIRLKLRQIGVEWRAEVHVMNLSESKFSILSGDGDTPIAAISGATTKLQDHLAREIV